MRTIVAIGVAGAAGTLARYGLEGVVSRRVAGTFPWGTFVVNVTGAFVLGFLFTVLTDRLTVAPWLRIALTVGFLGAYTTFSTLSFETYRLMEDGSYLMAALNAFGSLTAGMVAVFGGVILGRAV